MALPDNCKEILCGIAVAGGAVAATALGVNVATGIIEFLTHGGNLALAVNKQQQDRCEKLVAGVKKAVERDFDDWLKGEFGDDWSARADVNAGLSELGRVLPHIKPTTADIIDCAFDAETLYQKMKARLPEHSLFRSNPVSEQVLRSVILRAYRLIRSDDAFSNELTSFAFERVLGNLSDLGAKMDAVLDTVTRQHLETSLQSKRHHEQVMAALAREKGVPRDNLRSLFEAAGQEVPERDFERAIRVAVNVLLARGADPVALLNDSAEIRHAIEIARQKLRQADTDGAIEHLRQARLEQAEMREQRMRGEARLAAEEADILKLAFRFDEAIEAYEDAAKLDPSDAWNWFHIGDIHISRGSLNKALKACEQAQTTAESSGNQRDLSVSYNKTGDVLVAQGDLTTALSRYGSGLEIRARLAKSDPGNAQWQRDLSVSYERTGDVLVAQGDLTTALSRYGSCLEIADRLAKSDPGNAQWQRDLSVSYDRIGDVLVAQGDLTTALSRYGSGLEIADRLAKSDPGNAEWQRDLSVSYNKTGDVLVAQGDLTTALSRYGSGLEIRARLAKSDPGNAEWQRDLSVSYIKTGDVLVAQGDLATALSRYGSGLEIADRLAKSDPLNAQWQRDLSVSYDRIGNVLVAQGDLATALSRYGSGLEIADRLAKSDPLNAQWQRDLSVSYIKTGDVLVAQGDLATALSRYGSGLEIADRLAKSDPLNAQWQRDLVVSHVKLAGFEKPVEHYEAALKIVTVLEAQGRLAPQDQWMVTDLQRRLKEAGGEGA